MSIKVEGRLVSEIAEIEDTKRVLIRKIVAASLKGQRDEDSLSKMGTLSKKKLVLTRPSRSIAA